MNFNKSLLIVLFVFSVNAFGKSYNSPEELVSSLRDAYANLQSYCDIGTRKEFVKNYRDPSSKEEYLPSITYQVERCFDRSKGFKVSSVENSGWRIKKSIWSDFNVAKYLKLKSSNETLKYIESNNFVELVEKYGSFFSNVIPLLLSDFSSDYLKDIWYINQSQYFLNSQLSNDEYHVIDLMYEYKEPKNKRLFRLWISVDNGIIDKYEYKDPNKKWSVTYSDINVNGAVKESDLIDIVPFFGEYSISRYPVIYALLIVFAFFLSGLIFSICSFFFGDALILPKEHSAFGSGYFSTLKVIGVMSILLALFLVLVDLASGWSGHPSAIFFVPAIFMMAILVVLCVTSFNFGIKLFRAIKKM